MGAIRFAVGADGATYCVTNDKGEVTKEYELTGWTLDAVSQQERLIEDQAVEALNRIKMTPDQRNNALAILAGEIGCFKFSYGSLAFDASLKSYRGLAHMFWQLAKTKQPKLSQDECLQLVKNDSLNVHKAVINADPTNRVQEEMSQESETKS